MKSKMKKIILGLVVLGIIIFILKTALGVSYLPSKQPVADEKAQISIAQNLPFDTETGEFLPSESTETEIFIAGIISKPEGMAIEGGAYMLVGAPMGEVDYPEMIYILDESTEVDIKSWLDRKVLVTGTETAPGVSSNILKVKNIEEF